jgi:CHAT domain-containing protein
MNRVTEAIVEMDQAAEIQREISDTPSLAQTFAVLAHVKLKTGRAEEALKLAEESEQILSSIERPETLWQAQLVAGQALRRLGHGAEAAKEFEAAMATIESLRTRVAGPPTALPVYFADKLEPYQQRVAISLAAGKTDEALRFTEQSKSRALGDILRSGRVNLDKALTPSEKQTERRLENGLVELNLRIAKQPDNTALKANRNRARREIEAFQSQIYANHPETAFERGASPPLSTEEMARLAAETKAVFLDYLVTPRNTYVFVLKPGTRARVVTLGIGATALRAKTAEFHRQLASHDLGYAAAAHELYCLLVAPVERDLAGQAAVVIIPDGPLWDVSFQALQSGPKHFLMEDAVVSYAPSLAVLRETLRTARDRRAAPAARELLALGDPTTEERLPEAERQVREIEKLYGSSQSRLLTGDSATEAQLKAEAGNYRVIHLASHAVLDDVNPMYSRALLAKGSGEDGILEARELMQLNLRAELLVLSACQTARGDAPAGEGINGMLWAALGAGAPTTVASLWQVESASTSRLMIDFHRHWLDARRSNNPFAKASALRAAAMDLARDDKYSHPFYWAAFILVGSPN